MKHSRRIGHIFVTRVAGNIATSAMIASREYGVAVLGTKVVLVLGHANCGAVKAAIEAKAVPGQISTLYPHIRPAVDQAGSNLEGGDQGQCHDPGCAAAAILARSRRAHQAEQAETRCRLLRAGKRQCHLVGLRFAVVPDITIQA
jgi:carbonic anhydrase